MYHQTSVSKGGIVADPAVTAYSSGKYDRHHIDIAIYHQQSEPQVLIVNAALSPGRAGRRIGIDISIIVYTYSQGQGRPIGHLPTIQDPETLHYSLSRIYLPC
jgi:hypothetical protein